MWYVEITIPLSPANLGQPQYMKGPVNCSHTYFFFLIGREHGYLMVGNVGPHHELLPPLHHRDAIEASMSDRMENIKLTTMCKAPDNFS
jgi:hypothetical protein